MTYKYGLIMICAFGTYYNTFATEDPIDKNLSEKIQLTNKEAVKESKEALKSLTGSFIQQIKETVLPNEAKQDSKPDDFSAMAKPADQQTKKFVAVSAKEDLPTSSDVANPALNNKTNTEFDNACKLLDSLPTLHSVDEFVSLLNKLEKHIPKLSATESKDLFNRIPLIENKMDPVAKDNFVHALVTTRVSKEIRMSKVFKNNPSQMKDFVDKYNTQYAAQIADGTMLKMEYADSSEILTSEQQKNLINECKRGPFISGIAKLYAQHKFAMIAGGTALLTGICALVYKAYQKYHQSKNNNSEFCKIKNK